MRFSWIPRMAFGLVLAACSTANVENPDTTSKTKVDATTAQAALLNYATNLRAAYTDSVTDAQNLKVKLQALVATPSADTLAAARTEWLKSRQSYLLVEGARFYGGPIDGDDFHNPEGDLNSWPLDEAYIDYVSAGPTRSGAEPGSGGIIADRSIALSPATLDAMNAEGGDENISAGWHAIEFLLWGQALADVGPGVRSYKDYDKADATHGDTAERRGQYLLAAADGIIGLLTVVADQWKDGADYRTKFLENANDESIVNALAGLGKMSKGELAGERINAGLESKARRDQHDCFSSETLVDYARDAQGMHDLWIGKYGTNDGVGLDELVAKSDQALADKITAQLQGSVDKIVAIKVPFEQAIQGLDTDPNRAALIGVRDSLRVQGDLFGNAATALGLSLTVPDKND